MSTDTKQPGIYYGWYVVATCLFLGFVTVGARNVIGIFVLPMEEDFGWAIPFLAVGALLFPAALSAFTNNERRYSVRYLAQTAAASAGD